MRAATLFRKVITATVHEVPNAPLLSFECAVAECRNWKFVNFYVGEKLDSITLEYTYLLTSQLESQRLYFEEKMSLVESEARSQVDHGAMAAISRITMSLE